MEKKEFATQISELYWRQHDNVEHPKLSVDATVGFIFLTRSPIMIQALCARIISPRYILKVDSKFIDLNHL